MPVPLLVGGRAVHWIDSKATFGDLASHNEYSSHQFSAYLNRFDAGLVIYWFGFVDEVAALDPRILVLDHFPEDCRLMQGSGSPTLARRAAPSEVEAASATEQ
uniref:CDAN1-interacting nuclease 1 n=1 Tax=Phaeocystis antarctica TaxID=33657 RepID=A0A7S0EY83_9EUKA